MTPGKGQARNLRHLGIVVRDMEKSLAFYRDLLGMEVTSRREETGAYLDTLLGVKHGKIQTVKLSAGGGATLLELIEFESPEPGADPERQVNTPGPTHIAVTVADVKRLSAALKRNGIRFVSEPLTSPGRRARLAFCRDPEGNLVELVEERPNP